jgi:hypothetical protein
MLAGSLISATIEGNINKLLSTSVIWLAVVIAAQAQLGDIQSLKRLYNYDPKQPLDYKETLLYEREGITLYYISYASPRGGRVTAYLVMPVGEGPFAGLVFGHWGPGNRTEFLPEAMLYAEAGATSLLIDYPWIRPSPPQGIVLSQPRRSGPRNLRSGRCGLTARDRFAVGPSWCGSEPPGLRRSQLWSAMGRDPHGC